MPPAVGVMFKPVNTPQPRRAAAAREPSPVAATQSGTRGCAGRGQAVTFAALDAGVNAAVAGVRSARATGWS